MYRISVILPTYKPGSYIEECIESVLSQQGLGLHFSILLLIILNGEHEPYYSYLKKYEAAGRADVKLYYSYEKGVSNARNLGIGLAQQSDYIVFVDDDDHISNTYLLELLNAVTEKPNVVAQSNTKVMGGEEGTHYISKAINRLIKANRKYSPCHYRRLLNSVCGKLFPTHLLESICFNTSLTNSEDALFMFELSSQIKGIELVPTVYYEIREREGSAMRTKRTLGENVCKSYQFIRELSKAYFKAPLSYSFLLYVSRVLASVKHLVHQVRYSFKH